MAAKECCVRDCPAENAEDVKYFRLPLNVKRRQQWLKLIGRTDLIQERRDHFVCSIHFDETQIAVLKKAHRKAIPTRCIPSMRKGLPIFSSTTASQTDFPYKDDDDDDECDGIVVYKCTIPNREIIVCCDLYDDEVKPIYYNETNEEPTFSLNCSENKPRDSVHLGNRKIFAFCEGDVDDEDIGISVNVTKCIPSLPSTNDKPKPVATNNEGNDIVPVITSVVSLHNTDNSFKDFFDWRCRVTERRKGAKYDRNFKMFALHLHTINTRAYRLVTDSWQLPKESDLKNIKLNIEPGLSKPMITLLDHKFKLLSSKGKFCTIGLYAMALKPHIFYDPAKDDVVGVHNVNGTKKNTAATYALIAMARGLIVPWHQPVAYSLFSTLTDNIDDINLFLVNIVEKLKNMSLHVLGVVISDDSFFWNYCRLKHFTSLTKPYLNIGKDKLYIIFDIPHALSMFKDEFMDDNYMFAGKHIVSGKFVKKVYDIDKEKEGKLLPELTDEHMKVGNTKKNLEHSFQIFREEVCGAIYFYTDHGSKNIDAIPTGHFIKRLSEVLDVINSKYENKSNESRVKSVVAQNKAFENGFALFKQLAKVVKGKLDNAKLDSIRCLLISFKSLLHISSMLNDADEIGIAQTKMTYLKPLLEFVKSIKKDTTEKPSPIKFVRSFSKLFVKNLIDLTPPPKSIDTMDRFLEKADETKDCFESSGNRIHLKSKDYRFTLPETYAIIYVSSYLLYKCTEIHTCTIFEAFLKRLIDLNKTKVNVHFVNLNKEAAFYDKLKLPPIELPAYVERLDNCFLACFNDFINTNVAETIYRVLKNVPRWKQPCPCFPIEYMLKLFVRTRIYETVLDNTKCLKNLSLSAPYTLKFTKLC